MKEVRFRTEAFSGLGERNIVDVMCFETFELGNTDILETLQEGVLKGNSICDLFGPIIDYLEGANVSNCYENIKDQTAFFEKVVNEIRSVTGLDIKYVLWLADKATVTDREWYGRDMADDLDFDSYEIGPVVLSELGYDGTLYGYVDLPISLEERIEQLKEELTDIINERENDDLSEDRMNQLDDRYLEIDHAIHEIDSILDNKNKVSLCEQIKNAEGQKSRWVPSPMAKTDIDRLGR